MVLVTFFLGGKEQIWGREAASSLLYRPPVAASLASPAMGTGHWGTCPPRLPTVLIFLLISELQKLLTLVPYKQKE